IRLDINETTPVGVEDEEFFFKVARGAFAQRRKTLLNSISASLGIGKDIVLDAVKKSGLSETVRPEELKMEDFIKVSKNLKIFLQG
ncbi:MAG: 16S rRNA (adenine(1518)-N(6)/adenine(1519)-N(6))-dimethyltransferase, partial [Oscillospiraceae bacterium]|nr:16S rRNA (adenine(1518)-N(6)/adenine(1519)-N(6))-dimethyltransferase [Oscillospiraceae bacterium]